MAATQPVLIDGSWRSSRGDQTFQAINPAVKQPLAERYPVSPWDEIEEAIRAADRAFRVVRHWPGERFAAFLDAYASEIEARLELLVETALLETALPAAPRLRDVELPRTLNQMRQAAAAARSGSWALPTIDTAAKIRSAFGSLGPVAVFGPNNFPFAFNSIAGGDFAAAVAAGNPVIAKGHSSHPRTTQLFAEAAQAAAKATGMPDGFVQLIYRTSHEDGARFVSHPLLGATGYTGARHAGLVLKEAADRAGNPIYLELSSINPVFVLPGAIEERGTALVEEIVGSCLLGAGQFCTNPGLLVFKAGPQTDEFIAAMAERYAQAPVGTLLGEGVEQNLRAGIVALQRGGAEVVAGAEPVDLSRCCHANTLLRASGDAFLQDPAGLQEEAFGNCTLAVVATSDQQLVEIARRLDGNLTGCLYSNSNGKDDDLYDRIAPELRPRVGRLLNDKMPTGVAVSAAMNHGGPFPATGHPGFTAVGIPASLRRFAMLHCYDNVRESRLPKLLQNPSPGEDTWRLIDGTWSTGDVPTSAS